MLEKLRQSVQVISRRRRKLGGLSSGGHGLRAGLERRGGSCSSVVTWEGRNGGEAALLGYSSASVRWDELVDWSKGAEAARESSKGRGAALAEREL